MAGRVDVSISETVEWEIPDFLISKNRYFESPVFDCAGCKWKLRVFPRGNLSDQVLAMDLLPVFVMVELQLLCAENDKKTVTVFGGIKREDGTLEEMVCKKDVPFMVHNIFGCIQFLLCELTELQNRKSKLVPSGMLTMTCRFEEKATPGQATPKSLVPGKQHKKLEVPDGEASEKSEEKEPEKEEKKTEQANAKEDKTEAEKESDSTEAGVKRKVENSDEVAVESSPKKAKV